MYFHIQAYICVHVQIHVYISSIYRLDTHILNSSCTCSDDHQKSGSLSLAWVTGTFCKCADFARLPKVAPTTAQGPKRPRKHQDPAQPNVWNPPDIGPWNQHVGSFCLSGLLGPSGASSRISRPSALLCVLLSLPSSACF